MRKIRIRFFPGCGMRKGLHRYPPDLAASCILWYLCRRKSAADPGKTGTGEGGSALAMDIGVLAALAPLLFLLLGLGFTVVIDPYIRRENRRIMLVIVLLCLTLIAQNLVENSLASGPARVTGRTLVSVYGYIVRPVFLILFLYIVHPEGKHWLWWGLAAGNAAVCLTALFSDICFMIGSDNHYHPGPLANTTLYISAVLLANLLVQTLRSRREAGKQEKWIPVFIAAMIVLSVLMDSRVQAAADQPVAFLTIAIVVGSVFYYLWLHLQFVRGHEQDLMAAQRITIMASQIRPHFLYNTIATIRALCRRDPEKAEKVAEDFGRYLRQNMDSLESAGLIPSEKELEHTRCYADIEMVRFENIRVEYDIGDRVFTLPPLTVQPMVENAIRHGVRIRKEGVVRVSSRFTDGCHEIRIQDNGIGFDVNAIEAAGGSHIGIRNVRERIETQCGGSLLLESRMGEGTTVIIRIPGRREKA